MKLQTDQSYQLTVTVRVGHEKYTTKHIEEWPTCMTESVQRYQQSGQCSN